MIRRHLIAAAMLVALPLLTYYLWICLTFHAGGLVVPRSGGDLIRLLGYVPAPTATSLLLYGSWLLLQVGLHVAAPGPGRDGAALDDGSRLRYRLNGWFSFWATWLVLLLAVWSGVLPPDIAYEQFGPLLTTANIVAFAFAAYLYFRGRSASEPTASGGLYGYVTGVSLNPRVRHFDLKFFCESRPGLMLWVVINASLAAKQYELHGTVTTPMLLVNAFQFFYVADYFFHEEAILTTWDIRHERFGWMLCWGCLVWVPFTFSIQAYYLVTHAHDLSAAATAGIVALNLVGYAVFRSANLQKHRFRRDPSRPVWGRPPEYIRTGSGALLLTSGWWGLARHLNYFGDLLMGLAWCLPAGFAHPLPYFYIVYFLILLIHRERRDHAMCRQKYGRDWEAYCRKVRWRIVPGLY
jgi:protein-S-isoprenylcysteine O-methyltransferase Ste14